MRKVATVAALAALLALGACAEARDFGNSVLDATGKFVDGVVSKGKDAVQGVTSSTNPTPAPEATPAAK
jgi:hypothetical protein